METMTRKQANNFWSNSKDRKANFARGNNHSQKVDASAWFPNSPVAVLAQSCASLVKVSTRLFEKAASNGI